eukprot:jgi/Astpho2/2923/fgenesh1_pg.00050_%23_164_t
MTTDRSCLPASPGSMKSASLPQEWGREAEGMGRLYAEPSADLYAEMVCTPTAPGLCSVDPFAPSSGASPGGWMLRTPPFCTGLGFQSPQMAATLLKTGIGCIGSAPNSDFMLLFVMVLDSGLPLPMCSLAAFQTPQQQLRAKHGHQLQALPGFAPKTSAPRPRAASSRRKRSLDADFELEVPCKSSRRAAEAGIRRRQSTSREMEEAADAAAEEEEVALLRSMGQRPSRGSGGRRGTRACRQANPVVIVQPFTLVKTFGQSRVSEINTRIKALHDGGSQSADEASEPSTSSQASLKIARSFSHCL